MIIAVSCNLHVINTNLDTTNTIESSYQRLYHETSAFIEGMNIDTEYSFQVVNHLI